MEFGFLGTFIPSGIVGGPEGICTSGFSRPGRACWRSAHGCFQNGARAEVSTSAHGAARFRSAVRGSACHSSTARNRQARRTPACYPRFGPPRTTASDAGSRGLRDEFKLRFQTKSAYRTKCDVGFHRQPNAHDRTRFEAPAEEQGDLIADRRFHGVSFRGGLNVGICPKMVAGTGVAPAYTSL